MRSLPHQHHGEVVAVHLVERLHLNFVVLPSRCPVVHVELNWTYLPLLRQVPFACEKLLGDIGLAARVRV